MHGLNRKVVRRRAAQLINQDDFLDTSRRIAKGCSGGMMRQLNLLMVLISNPAIFCLDEPIIGMDARAYRRTWEHIASLKDQDITVILTTHYIENTQYLSDRVGIINCGELIACGSPDELMAQHEFKYLENVFFQITGRRIAEGS
jgi:ABC-2 type transport system ATP-binding protein